jgi:hypothetical protein
VSQELLEAARAAIARGFRIFPLVPGTKRPAIDEWQLKATSDPALVEKVWALADYNIGVLCDGMIVVDVDVKNGKPGMESLAALNLDLDTYTVRTPTGGLHVYYTGESGNSAGTRLGPGLDVRSKGGYVVGAGSIIGSYRYTSTVHGAVQAAPGKLVSGANSVASGLSKRLAIAEEDTPAAVAAAIDYLENRAPLAVEGRGGDHCTYTVACFLRDFGIAETTALGLLAEYWNPRCVPPWGAEDLADKVANAFRYAENAPGSKSPEHWFKGIALEPEPQLPAPAGGEYVVQFFEPDQPITAEPWLFYKTLPAVGVAVLVGPSGAGKTFLLNTLAHRLATGGEFFSTAPDDPGGTIFLYAGTEGSGFNNRMRALGIDHTMPIGHVHVADLRERGKLKALCVALQAQAARMQQRFGVPPRMLVLETLSASGLIEDESNAAMASAAMAALGLLSRILGVLVVVSHHPPKVGTGSRGSGSITNSADYVIEVVREPGHKVRDVHLTKARGAEERTLGSFTLVEVELGRDSRDRPINTMVASLGEPANPLMRKAAHADKFIEAMEMTMDADGVAEFAEVQSIFGSLVKGTGDRSRQFKQVYEYALATAAVELIHEDGRQIFKRRVI